MSEKNIFLKIVDRELPAEIVYEDEQVLAFRDIKPRAPTHVLIIPKREIPSVADIGETDAALLGRIWTAIPKIAAELGLDGGYRVVANCGSDGGQEVPHLHFHLLGGRQLAWPPG